MRIITGLPTLTPTTTLLSKTNSLSIQQLIAKSTLMMVFKILQTSKPKYLAEKMKVRTSQGERRIPHRSIGMLEARTANLSLSKESFIVRGSQLFNKLPVSLRLENDVIRFKQGMIKWVAENVRAKPI